MKKKSVEDADSSIMKGIIKNKESACSILEMLLIQKLNHSIYPNPNN
jgi:hypothetical protein